ncbi:MAG TPA: hypothetical protein VFP35_01275 [Candidatus Saccharimonadales bacterium]|nr:hypothetical protein [Candidatus Saccharimonadales bacterium]
MEERPAYIKRKLAVVTSIASLILILLTIIWTDPNRSIAFSVWFFILLFIFVFSLGTLVIGLQSGSVSLSAKRRLILFDSLITVILMLTSSRSISLINLLILVLIIGGLNFYFNSREA